MVLKINFLKREIICIFVHHNLYTQFCIVNMTKGVGQIHCNAGGKNTWRLIERLNKYFIKIKFVSLFFDTLFYIHNVIVYNILLCLYNKY